MKYYYDSIVKVPPPFGVSARYLTELATEVIRSEGVRHPDYLKASSVRVDSLPEELRDKLLLLFVTYFPMVPALNARVVMFNHLSMQRYTALNNLLTMNVILHTGPYGEVLETLNKRRDDNEAMDYPLQTTLRVASSFIMEADCWQACNRYDFVNRHPAPLPIMLLQADYVLESPEQKHSVVDFVLTASKELAMQGTQARLNSAFTGVVPVVPHAVVVDDHVKKDYPPPVSP